jgi:hypothetical protein
MIRLLAPVFILALLVSGCASQQASYHARGWVALHGQTDADRVSTWNLCNAEAKKAAEDARRPLTGEELAGAVAGALILPMWVPNQDPRQKEFAEVAQATYEACNERHGYRKVSP